MLEIGQKVDVKVLDIDRERQRISLGLKQTQTDPWQQVLESYNEGDVVSGKVTKVVTFGAFVEILPGVEGLVHISELAQHHVENPREVVSQGDTVNVRILEVDAERRRLSLSLKRVDDGMPLQPDAGEDAAPPTIDLSEDVFADEAAAEPAAEARRSRARSSPRATRLEPAARRSPAPRPRPTTSPTSPPRARTRAVSRRDSVPRPLTVALTGGIAAGKSEALDAFARHGAATASSDEIVHTPARRGRGRARRDPRALGRGRGRRPRAHRRDRLQDPASSSGSSSCSIRARVALAQTPGSRPVDRPLAVIEIPLLFETGGEKRFDKVVVITAAPRAAAAAPRPRSPTARRGCFPTRRRCAAPTSPMSTTARSPISTRSSRAW